MRLTFSGTPGQLLGFGIDQLYLTTADGTPASRRLTLYGPGSSTPLATGNCIAVVGNPNIDTCDLSLPILQVSGTYSLVVDIGVVDTSTYEIDTYLSENIITSTPAGGAAVLNLSPGQNATVTFAGNAGETTDLVLTLLNALGNFPVGTVTAPNGTQIASFGGSADSASNPTLVIPLPALPADGTYSIVFEQLASQYSLGVSVDTPYSASTTLTSTGRSIYEATASANQNVTLTFAGQAGQNLSLGISSLVEPSVNTPSTTVSVALPSGSTLSTTTCTLSCVFDLANLPTTGTYTVTVKPTSSVTMNFVATLSNDLIGSIDVSNPYTGSTTRIGQIMRLGVNGSPGASYGVYFKQVDVTGDEYGTESAQVLNPDGTASTTPSIFSFPQTLAMMNLPQSGVYTIVISPGGSQYLPAALDMQLVLNASVPLVVNGPTLQWDITHSGPEGMYTFDASQGENLGLGITMTIPSTGNNYQNGGQYLIYKPDGSLWIGPSDCVSGQIYFLNGSPTVDGCTIDLSALSLNGNLSIPESGTYTLRFVNDYTLGNTSFDVTLSSWNTAQLTPNGPTVNVNVTRPGQAAAPTFNGTAGQTFQLQWGNTNANPITVFDPNGKQVVSVSSTRGYSVDIPTLAQTGNYTVYSVFPNGSTGSLPLTLVTLSSCSQRSGPIASVVSPVSVQPATPTAGQPFAVSATVTPAVPVCGQPQGTMSVIGNNGTYGCSYNTASASSCNITASAGPIRFYASFTPTDTTTFQPGTSTAYTNVAVAGNSVNVAITSITPEPSSVGQPYSVQVVVTPVAPATATPTGTVSVTGSDGANCTFILPATSCTLTGGNTGPVTIAAFYYGDVSYSQTSSPSVTHYVGAVLSPTISGFTPASGTVGTQVTISGSNLYAGTPPAVAFNGVTARVLSASLTQLVAIVPNGATSGPITVAPNAFGSAVASASNFTVVKPGTGIVTVTVTGANAEPAIVGQAYTVAVSVTAASGTPTGTVQVGSTANSCYVTLPNTTCTLTGEPAVGEVQLFAVYNGDANFAVSTSPMFAHITNPATPTEMCGLDPNTVPNDPPGFVPIQQLSGAVYTPGLTQDIAGNGNLSVSIASPTANATTADTTIDVAGTFVGPVNTGIVVNGMVAATVDGHFLASDVPLNPGSNTITVTATTLTGATATNSATVTQGAGSASPLTIVVDGQTGATGFAPKVVTFDLAVGTLPDGGVPQTYSLDPYGNGAYVSTASSLTALANSVTYPLPGAYTAVFAVTDSKGNTYTASRAALIQDHAEQRYVLCDIYGYLKNRLNAQDANGAANIFQSAVRAQYGSLFSALGSNMPGAATMLGYIADGFVALGGHAQMTVVRDNADQTRSGYPVRLTRGTDGVWRLSEM
ncbi:MAG: beta strand repeat-containing protein [Sulfuricaulis sp.]